MKLAAGIALCVAGVAGFAVFLVSMLLAGFSDLVPLEVPGRRTLDLREGDYTVYWESEGRVTGARAPDLSLAVLAKFPAPHHPVVMSPIFTSKYSTGSRIGISILTFKVETAGPYELEASASTPARGLLKIGRGFGLRRLLLIVLGSIAILGAGLGPGIFLIVRSSRGA